MSDAQPTVETMMIGAGPVDTVAEDPPACGWKFRLYRGDTYTMQACGDPAQFDNRRCRVYCSTCDRKRL